MPTIKQFISKEGQVGEQKWGDVINKRTTLVAFIQSSTPGFLFPQCDIYRSCRGGAINNTLHFSKQ